MSIKFKQLFKTLLVLPLLFTSCQNDDLVDSKLDPNSFSEFKLSRAGGDRIYNFTIGVDDAFASDLIITNKITNNEGFESIFIISEAVVLDEVVVENEPAIQVIRHQILSTLPTIEAVREFNFDMGIQTTYRIWNIRNRGVINGLDNSSTGNSIALVENIYGDDFAITSLGEAITVNMVPFIENNVQSQVPTEPVTDAIPEGQPSAPTSGFTLTFDENIDYTFGDGGNSSFFANTESEIVALVTAGDPPSDPVDNALRVDFTPSNVINAEGQDQGFFFGGTIFELSELGLPEVDFTGTNKTITLNVFSNTAFNVRVQISDAELQGENRNNVSSPTPGFKNGSHAGEGWQQIEIDFSSGVSTIFELEGVEGGQPQTMPLDGFYNRIQLQFEGLPTGLESTVFVDNINYIGSN